MKLKFLAPRVTPPAHPAQALVPKRPKIAPTWPQHGAKMGPTISKIEPRWGPGAPKWSHNGAKMGSEWRKNQKNTNATKKRVALHRAPPPGAEKVVNMAPTWVPKWSQDGQKIDAKIDHLFDASWE